VRLRGKAAHQRFEARRFAVIIAKLPELLRRPRVTAKKKGRQISDGGNRDLNHPCTLRTQPVKWRMLLNNRGPVATPAGHFFATYAPWGSGRCSSDFRFGAPQINEPPAPVRSLLRVCIPRRRDSIITFQELDEPKAMTRTFATQHNNRSFCATQTQKPQDRVSNPASNSSGTW